MGGVASNVRLSYSNNEITDLNTYVRFQSFLKIKVAKTYIVTPDILINNHY